MSKVLVIRLSAFGDNAMLVPVIYSVAKAYPDSRFIVLTRKEFSFLYKSWNIEPMTFSPKRHKGFLGLMKLRRAIRNRKFTDIADVHDVLRSKILRANFLGGPKVAHIDKGRAEKQRMIKTKDVSVPLMPTTERYKKVFEELGFNFEITFKNFFEGKEINYSSLREWKPVPDTKRIGIAPFARHRGKIYPLGKMEKVVEALSADPNTQIFLFGGNDEEKRLLKRWEQHYPNVICTVGKLFQREELLLIHSLDVMITMDSANMHLASLVETPVVSIWGATHPSLGFYGYGQKLENAVQVDLSCRPCSVYGDKPCERKDYACMNMIQPEEVVKRVESVIKSK